MKWGKAVIDWWTTYVGFLALPILMGAAIYAWLQPPRSWFCKADEMCGREWISALSGWVAAAAALAAILTTLTIEKRKLKLKIAEIPDLARVFTDELNGLRTTVAILNNTVEQLKTADDWDRAKQEVGYMLDVIREQLQSQVVLEAEKRFFPLEASTSLAMAKTAVAIARYAVSTVKVSRGLSGYTVEGGWTPEDLFAKTRHAIAECHGYAQGSQLNTAAHVSNLRTGILKD